MDRAGRRRRAGWRGRRSAGIQEIPSENGDDHQRQKEPEPAKSASLSLDSNFRHPFLPFSRSQSPGRLLLRRAEVQAGRHEVGKGPLLESGGAACQVTHPTLNRMP
jgi:hypothetical protein